MLAEPFVGAYQDVDPAVGYLFSTFERFCGALKIDDFETGARRPMELTGIQRAYCADRTSRDVVLKARKVYFSTLELARDLWCFLTEPGARVVAVVQVTREHEPKLEFIKTVQTFLESLAELGVRLPIASKSAGRWSMPSRGATFQVIEAGAGLRSAKKSGRGSAITRLHLSEMSSYEHGGVTMAALLNAMPAGGRGEVTIESTPLGAGTFFHKLWEDAVAGRGYTAHFFPWYLHEAYRKPLAPGETIKPEGQLAELEAELLRKGVAPEAIAWLRAKLPDFNGDVAALKQEFPSDPESCWLGSGDQYVPTALLEQRVRYDPVPVFEGPTFGGVDFGRKKDLTVVVTLKMDRFGGLWLVDKVECRRTDWDVQIATIKAAFQTWGWRRVCLDETGIGSMPAETIEKALGRMRVEKVAFGEQSKTDLATGLYAAIALSKLTLFEDPDLEKDVKAIKRYVAENGRVYYDAPSTADGHADRAWALALALRAAGVTGGPPVPPKRELGAGDYARGNA